MDLYYNCTTFFSTATRHFFLGGPIKVRTQKATRFRGNTQFKNSRRCKYAVAHMHGRSRLLRDMLLILPKIRIVKKKTLKDGNFVAGHVAHDIIKHLLPFVDVFCIFYLKRVKTRIFLQKRLDHLLLMTSYLVTIATESHQTCVNMCLRDIRTRQV